MRSKSMRFLRMKYSGAKGVWGKSYHNSGIGESTISPKALCTLKNSAQFFKLYTFRHERSLLLQSLKLRSSSGHLCLKDNI
jgi:hypothetical protein